MSKIIDTVFNRYYPPESVNVRQGDIAPHISANPEVMKKVTEVMEEIVVSFKAWKQNAIAEMLFLGLMILGVWTNMSIFLVAFLMYMWLRGRGNNIDMASKQRMGFIDGVLYTLNDVSRVVEEASKDPEFIKNFEQDMKDMKANLAEEKI